MSLRAGFWPGFGAFSYLLPPILEVFIFIPPVIYVPIRVKPVWMVPFPSVSVLPLGNGNRCRSLE